MATAAEKDNAISCLMHAINDAQETIRAYDTKAEILGVLITLAIGLTNFTIFTNSTGSAKWTLVISWLVALVAILSLGLVLHPKKNPFEKTSLGNFTPSSTYFLTNIMSSPQNTVATLAAKALVTDWVYELMYENMKLSVIRDRKHNYFTWALRLAGVMILLIITSIVIWIMQ